MTVLRLLYGGGDSADMRYAVGISIHDHFFLLEKGKQKLVFLDNRDIDYVKENGAKNLQTILSDFLVKKAQANTESVSFDARLAYEILKAYCPQKAFISVPENFQISIADYLRGKGYKLSVLKQFYPKREIKTSLEVARIESSLKRTKKAFVRIEEILSESKIAGKNVVWKNNPLTSEILKQEVMLIFAKENLEASVGLIISSGKHSALPHHPGEGAIRAGEPIIVDLFPRDRESGYFADMTRTYVKGKPAAKLKKMYSAVLQAKEKVITTIKAGKPTKEAHVLCVDILKQQGFHAGEKGFTHATGHGVGLEIHEAPRIGRGPEVFKAGQVVTVEPGLYYKGVGGVRLEDVVLVTKKGCKNLTKYPCILEIP